MELDNVQNERQLPYYEVDLDAIELHEIASSTPLMSDANYQALKLDLENNGQKMPGMLYRGKLVDGRHRLKALRELGVKSMLFMKLPNNYTTEQVIADVKSYETRRHNSTATLAIMAYKEMVAVGDITQQEAAVKYGVPRIRVGEVKKIVEVLGRKDIIDWLFQGEKVDIGTIYKPKLTDSLPAIVSWLVANKGLQKANILDDNLQQDDLTDSEWLMVTNAVNKINKERESVRRAIANKIYSTIPNEEL